MMRRLWHGLFALGLALVAAAPGWAHNPILVDAAVAVDGDGDGDSVDLTVSVKQAELLYALGENRSLFRDDAEITALQPRIAAFLLNGIAVSADGVAVPMTWAGIAGPGSDDPVAIHLHGKTTGLAKALNVVITLFTGAGMPGNLSIIDNVHLDAADRTARQAGTVKPGEPVMFAIPAHGTGNGAVDSGGSQGNHGGAGSFLDFVRMGFFHILPEGTDHILFVLGLFLLSPKWKPLLTQVTAFTIAHSLTLGLSLAGIFSLPSRIVEPMIAASIVVVAVENIWLQEVRPGRWMIVFAFGLVHGLGFAGALKDLHLAPGDFLRPLVGFNCGVEGGQLAVICLAAAATVWFWKKPWYRSRIVVPSSTVIAAIGLFWAIQRGLGYGIDP